MTLRCSTACGFDYTGFLTKLQESVSSASKTPTTWHRLIDFIQKELDQTRKCPKCDAELVPVLEVVSTCRRVGSEQCGKSNDLNNYLCARPVDHQPPHAYGGFSWWDEHVPGNDVVSKLRAELAKLHADNDAYRADLVRESSYAHWNADERKTLERALKWWDKRSTLPRVESK